MDEPDDAEARSGDSNLDLPRSSLSRSKRIVTAVLVVAAAAGGWVKGGSLTWPAPMEAVGAQYGPARPSRLAGDGEGGPAADQETVEAILSQAESEGQQDGPGHGEDGGPANEAVRPVRIYSHRVQEGETLWDIARQYGTDVATIASANALFDVDFVRPGRLLQVPDTKGIVHTVQSGESLWELSRLYGVSADVIVKANALATPELIRPGTRLVIPGAKGPRTEKLVVDGRLLRAFSQPVKGRIASRYGWRWGRLHEGIDIAVPQGTPVRASAPGRVVFAGWGGGYGYLVSIDHGYGVVTRYAHNSRIVVRVGQHVMRGQVVAYSGNTGNSTGPHVHFEIRYRGRAVNPLSYLR
ncbi:MAG: M23 family metallopeptidase [Bacillota bacterium]